MKVLKDGKEYIQINDLIFINKNLLDIIPMSLRKKLQTNDIIDLGIDDDAYIELSTSEEKEFINRHSFIFIKNYLDILTFDQIQAIFDNLLYEINQDVQNKKIIKYKYNCLIDYVNNRMEKDCENCKNYSYDKTEDEKIGLDKDGNPAGYQCRNFYNLLLTLKKY